MEPGIPDNLKPSGGKQIVALLLLPDCRGRGYVPYVLSFT